VGTAGLTQIVAMRERFHSERINENVTAFSPGVQERLGQAVHTWLPGQLQALQGLSMTIRREAYLMGYSDAFYLACVALLGCALATMLMRKR
jgi:DHA2 family multidrug resistance protein